MGNLDRIKRLSEQGERDTAQKELVAFLRDDPRNVDAWWMLAQVLIDPRKKIEAYRHILNLDPEHMEAARQFAVLTLPPGQPLEASEEYQNALAEYYKKQAEMPQVPEPDKPVPESVPVEDPAEPQEILPAPQPDPPAPDPVVADEHEAEEQQAPRKRIGSPLDFVRRAFPTKQSRNVGELEMTDDPQEVEEPQEPEAEYLSIADEMRETLMSEATRERIETEELAVVEEPPAPEEPEDQLAHTLEEEAGQGAANEGEQAQTPTPSAADEPDEQQETGTSGEVGPASEAVESKPESRDEYPPEFREALENMRLQRGLRPDAPKPDVLKAAQSGLRPDVLRTNFVRDALGSTADRRIQDLADNNMDTLEPLQEDQRIQCPNCQATIAKDSVKCEWCGEKLTDNSD